METEEAALTLRAQCRPAFARVVRTTVAACASIEGFSLDRLADVRLLSDELFNAAYAAGADEVMFQVTPDHGGLILAMRAELPPGRSVGDEVLDFVRMFVDVVAPGCELSMDDDGLAFRGAVASDPT